MGRSSPNSKIYSPCSAHAVRMERIQWMDEWWLVCPDCHEIRGPMKRCNKCDERFQPTCRNRFLCQYCMNTNRHESGYETYGIVSLR